MLLPEAYWQDDLPHMKVGEGSRDLEQPLIHNVKSNQDVVNNVIIGTDRFIDCQILLDNVSACFVFFFLILTLS